MLHMEQKNYKLEIVRVLNRKGVHARGIAVGLGTNHMMVVRKMGELLSSNVVDVREEGRNKVYFIKDSVEARAYLRMMEQYKLINLLDKYPALRGIVDRIQKDKRVKLALIFGSYAKKTANKNSDLDIFIESQDIGLKKEYSRLDSKLSIKIGKLVKGDSLSEEIKKNHVLIKGVEKYYAKSFE
jgi:predicted nucleotidyltransferase